MLSLSTKMKISFARVIITLALTACTSSVFLLSCRKTAFSMHLLTGCFLMLSRILHLFYFYNHHVVQFPNIYLDKRIFLPHLQKKWEEQFAKATHLTTTVLCTWLDKCIQSINEAFNLTAGALAPLSRKWKVVYYQLKWQWTFNSLLKFTTLILSTGYSQVFHLNARWKLLPIMAKLLHLLFSILTGVKPMVNPKKAVI